MPEVGVGVFVVDSAGYFLLLKRDEEAAIDPAVWGLVGGKVEDGERVLEAAVREFYEEVGAVPVSTQQLPFYTEEFHESGRHFLTTYCLVTHWEGDIYNREPNKHSHLRWVSRPAIFDMATMTCLPEAFEKLADMFPLGIRGLRP